MRLNHLTPRRRHRPLRGWHPRTWRGILLAGALIVVALVVEHFIPPLSGAVRVADGDSLEISGERVRLEGIDAPELHQECGEGAKAWPCGMKARAALAALVAQGEVSCRPVDEDRYGRAVARCTVGGADIGAELVRQGWAMALGLAYRAEARAAKSAGAGIWAGPFETPAEWRARHPRPAE
ncbi:thermonuclease family protein [Ancylobacter vacuolatus]|uniref:Endonuclease YncB(Thermonuclease family) n=1 Tax=Ancylobacter vacuolatus TaxID=223389 RepID=A0ABU0DI10_9HYPH|nr:thermonuclease family protein [Ancylobacter vacuolatus]MDQ0347953.1 endonuclease YncB(thermonuclease family) [Ancylobacter vacuolatus]